LAGRCPKISIHSCPRRASNHVAAQEHAGYVNYAFLKEISKAEWICGCIVDHGRSALHVTFGFEPVHIEFVNLRKI